MSVIKYAYLTRQ